MENSSSSTRIASQWVHRWLLLAGLLLRVVSAPAQGNACSGTDPGGQPATSGLYAEYFRGYFDDNPGFFTDNRNPAGLARTEAQVNFPDAASFGDLLPLSDGTTQDADNFSLRLRGSLLISTAGTYTFYLTADDAAYLWIDGEAQALPPSPGTALINNGGRHSRREQSASVTLTAGRHSVLLLYGEDCCDNVLVWEYEGPGIARQIVPAAVLCTAPAAPPTAPQALSYAPAERALPSGTSLSSGVPQLPAGSAATGFAVANAASLPAGISLDAGTGVLTAGTGVAEGTYDVDVAVSNAGGTSIFRNAFRFRVTAPLPGGCGGSDPAGQPAAAGLYAEYFSGYFADDPAFFTAQTPGLVRTEAQVEFPDNDSFGNLLPVATGSVANPDEFSLRLRGSLYLAAAGTYTFYLTADDAAYLWLDNAALAAPLVRADALIDNGGYHLSQTVAVTLRLNAGLHNLALLYGDNGANNDLLLEYESTELGIARQVVPGRLFCTSLQPLLPLASALTYSPGTFRVTVGNAMASGMPTATSATPVVEFELLNAASLPAGIALDSLTGRVTAAASVPEGRYELTIAARNSAGNAVFEDAFVAEVVAVAPAGCSGLDAGGDVASSGLYGELYTGYFDDDLTFFNAAPVAARLTQALNFASTSSWGNLAGIAASTAPGPDPDGFSARFRGRIRVPATGTYTFYLTSDDGSLLWLDGAALAPTPTRASALIDNGGMHPETTKSATIFLTAGLHDALVLYGDNAAFNVLRLEYESADAGVTRQLVPAGNLCTTTSNAPLPVTLTRFGADVTGAGVVLRWETAQELNSAAFVVERSRNGQEFEPVGKVAAAGTTTRRQTYAFTDAAPYAGLSYYRLRQLDQDGSAHFSGVVPVRWDGRGVAASQLAVYPNPSPDGACTLRLEQPTAVPATLQVLDVTGRVVHTRQLPAATRAEYPLPLQHLPAGMYLVRVVSEAGVTTQRLERR